MESRFPDAPPVLPDARMALDSPESPRVPQHPPPVGGGPDDTNRQVQDAPSTELSKMALDSPESPRVPQHPPPVGGSDETHRQVKTKLESPEPSPIPEHLLTGLLEYTNRDRFVPNEGRPSSADDKRYSHLTDSSSTPSQTASAPAAINDLFPLSTTGAQNRPVMADDRIPDASHHSAAPAEPSNRPSPAPMSSPNSLKYRHALLRRLDSQRSIWQRNLHWPD
ncbi:hypothetical protein XA68_16107 [Ophiocordyceps unilateralis]|uniref:Uncharacterized protein n=1 Tax=Ophiocordyceps unilateralis TaxID=268505 RepID=A0A2A9P748_OPHUN|nr:hypothetical protein XA68_16107 [Ophiocordyceps unilateralis]